jgi:DNA-binding beta-propeller fold protein YncE
VIAACAQSGAVTPPPPTPVVGDLVKQITPPPPAPVRTRVVAREGASVVLAHLDDTLVAYAADADAKALRIADIDHVRDLGTIPLDGEPEQVIALADSRLVVTLRDRSEIAVLAGPELAVHQRLRVAAEPVGLGLSPDDRTLVVTSGSGHALTVIDVGEQLAVRAVWPVEAEPRAVVVSDDGRAAFVSHAMGPSAERVELATGKRRAIALAGAEDISGRHGIHHMAPRQACQGFALARSISPPGRLYAPDVLVDTGNTDVRSDGYGNASSDRPPEVFDVPVIDADRATPLPASLELRPALAGTTPCVLPRAAVATSAGSLLVACAGADTVLELDGASAVPIDVELRSWTVPAGPTGIAIDPAGTRAIVWSQLAHSVSSIALGDAPRIDTIVFATDDSPIARGRALFVATGDVRISNDGRACASCHPDGGQDALVWSTPSGARQTPMLAGRLNGTAPYGWNGDATDLRAHLARTFTRLHGTALHGDDLDALVAYLATLAPPASDDALSPLAAEGEAIFRSPEAACATCHGDDGRTPDGVAHNIHSGVEADTNDAFDTPSLRGLASSAPYYHDGRYPTLRQLVVGTRGRMGQKRRFTDHELDALVAYLGTR